MSGPADLIGNDAIVEIAIGQLADGTPPVFGNYIVMTGAVTDYDETEDVTEVDLTGLHPIRRSRPGSKRRDITINTFVPITGLKFINPDTSSIAKHYIRIRTVPHSSISLQIERIGYVKRWKWSFQGDKAQAEDIQINGDPDYTTT